MPTMRKCSKCRAETAGYRVARTDEAGTYATWHSIDGQVYCLQCAREVMHANAADGWTVGVFGSNDTPRYVVDCRDKSSLPISAHLREIINSRESDWF